MPQDERPEGTIRVHFTDNTYKTLKLTYDTPVGDVIEELCKRISLGGRHADPGLHELFIIAPGNQALRERRLLREDRPLEIQVKGGSTAFKFLFRETPQAPAAAQDEASAHCEGGGAGREDAEGPGGPEAPPIPVADASGRLRTGTLERLLEDSGTWHTCTVILDEDRLWYSQGPCGEDGSVGGGMTFLPLCDCDRVLECDDKRLLQLVTKGATMMFRARNSHERNSWLLAVVKQAALIKERDILLQAERIVSCMELRRADQQLARLEEFAALPGVLAVPETRGMFLEFLSRHCGEPASDGALQGLAPEEFLARLEAADDAGGARGAAWELAEGLFARFQEDTAVQCQLCRLAAGIA